MRVIAVFNFFNGVIILLQSILVIKTKSPIIWVNKELPVYAQYLFLILGVLLILSSAALFMRKKVGNILTFISCVVLLVYGSITCVYAYRIGVKDIASVPFITLMQLIILIYFIKRRDVLKVD